MKTNIIFHSTEEISEFVSIANLCDFDIDVQYGHICVDGKSLVGLMCIGIEHKMVVYSNSTNPVYEQMLSKFQFKETKHYGNLKKVEMY